MAGFQELIFMSSSIQQNTSRMTGVQYTANKTVRTTTVPTVNPWRFTLKVDAAMPLNGVTNTGYPTRTLLQELQNLGKENPQYVQFYSPTSAYGNTFWWPYQGQMTPDQINAITTVSFVGNQLVLTNLPNVPATTVLFRAGDIIEPNDAPFPYLITADVLRGTTTTVTVLTHRPNITIAPPVGTNILVGNSVGFYLFCPTMPDWSYNAGRYVTFNGPFELYEYIQ